MYRLFEMGDSGNCYKIRLLLNQLDIPYERVPTNILVGESRTDAFLKENPNGRVPLLILPDGRPLAESNAIMMFLAEGTAFIPEDPYDRAVMCQWLFFEQYSHEPFIATNRFWIHIAKAADEFADRIALNAPRGYAALDVMETRLGETDYFAGNRYSLADIALYSYTHVADEGGFSLVDYPRVRAWLERVRTTARHVPITA